MTRVAPLVAALEALARSVRLATEALVDAEGFDRWGPSDDVAQREAIHAAAASASVTRTAARAELDRRVAALRMDQPEVLDAWAAAHVALLDELLGRAELDSGRASQAARERAAWVAFAAGTGERVDSAGCFLHYDRALDAATFGLSGG